MLWFCIRPWQFSKEMFDVITGKTALGDMPQQRSTLWAERLSHWYWEQRKHAFLWTPVFVALGITFYLALPSMPPLVFPLIVFLMLLGGWLTCTGHQIKAALTVLLFVALGALVMHFRIMTVQTPVLNRDLGPVMVRGIVEDIEPLDMHGDARIVLRPAAIERLEIQEMPRLVRLKLREASNVRLGQKIEGLAKLHAPSAPAYPGGFDFRQYLYFQSIGAVGFFYKDVTVLEGSKAGIWHWVDRLREGIAHRIQASMSEEAAPIAMALLIGRKTAIPDGHNEAFRTAGLAHILAISGLHIGLLTGAVFFIVRLGLVYLPRAGLIFPIKKIAAMAALAAAVFYMLIAGATIPTQRATMMVAVVLLAVLFDRQAISLRSVALAALIVLLLKPESVFSASFQLSFAAVSSLIFAYGRVRDIMPSLYQRKNLAHGAWIYILSVLFTTIIASMATAPFAIYHFHRLATYDLLSNLIVVPVLGTVLMPLFFLALILMPLGLEALPLYGASLVVEKIISVAQWIESLDYAVYRATMIPQTALLLIVTGGLWFILVQGLSKWTGVIFAFGGVMMAQFSQLPIVFISDKATLIGFYDREQDLLSVSSLTKERFVRGVWAEGLGLAEERVQKWPKSGVKEALACDSQGCRIHTAAGLFSVVHTPLALREDCAVADVVIAHFPVRNKRDCNAYVIDYFDQYYKGSMAFYASGLAEKPWKMRASIPEQGGWPWALQRKR